jgi:hypothetical protein
MTTPTGECVADVVETAIIIERLRRCEHVDAAARANRAAHEAQKPRIAELIADRETWPEIDAEAQRRDEAAVRLPWYKKGYYRCTVSLWVVSIIAVIGAILSGIYIGSFNGLVSVLVICVLVGSVSVSFAGALCCAGPRGIANRRREAEREAIAAHRAMVLAEIDRWFDYENRLASAAAKESAIQATTTTTTTATTTIN